LYLYLCHEPDDQNSLLLESIRKAVKRIEEGELYCDQVYLVQWACICRANRNYPRVITGGYLGRSKGKLKALSVKGR
jgi:hypothetical protein